MAATSSCRSVIAPQYQLDQREEHPVRLGREGEEACGMVQKFEATEFMNHIFADEESLESLELEIERMKTRIRNMDLHIMESVEKQARASVRGRLELAESSTSIKDLFFKIKDISTNADRCEKMVSDICADILHLDNAKRNLVATKRAIEDIQTLEADLVMLRRAVDCRRFDEVVGLLECAKSILSTLSDWKEIDHVRNLFATFDSILIVIRSQVFNEFDYIDIHKLKKIHLNNLMDACLVIDAMGDIARGEFISQWARKQMGICEFVFKSNAIESQIEHIDKRYQWLLRWIDHYVEHFGPIFPLHWRVSEMASFQFCMITNVQMLEMLERTKLTLNVKSLKIALKNTLNFETSLCSYFSKQLSCVPVEELERELHLVCNNSQIQNCEALVGGANDDIIPYFENVVHQVMQKFKGSISMSFEGYMYLYVEHEKSIIRKQFEDLIGQESWSVDNSSHSKVFSSSLATIRILSRTRKRASLLNQSLAFFDVYDSILKTILSEYADCLKSKLDAAESDSLTSKHISYETVNNSNSNLSSNQILCCTMMNTGEYCRTMCDRIERTIKSEISDRFKCQIDLSNEKLKFIDIIARSRLFLMRLIVIDIEPAFVEMSSSDWNLDAISYEGVVDASPFAYAIVNYLSDTLSTLGIHYIVDCETFRVDDVEQSFDVVVIAPDYYRMICDSVASHVIARFDKAIRSCKHISDFGAQQLLMDLTQIKKTLESLPSMCYPPGGVVPKSEMRRCSPSSVATYLKKVRRQVGVVECTLKVIWSRPDSLIDTFHALLPNHTDTDLVAIMQLKGISAADQHSLLDAQGVPFNDAIRGAIGGDWVKSSVKSLILKLYNFERS